VCVHQSLESSFSQIKSCWLQTTKNDHMSCFYLKNFFCAARRTRKLCEESISNREPLATFFGATFT
ncbi:hypothetical protein HDU99_004503, partial [Rhizoclosmatium hyalinum]